MPPKQTRPRVDAAAAPGKNGGGPAGAASRSRRRGVEIARGKAGIVRLESWPAVWRWGNGVACAGVAQFLLVAFVAAKLYPGGYSFFGHFVSDLGRTRTLSGEPNLGGAIAFDASLALLGLTTIPFFLFLPTHAPDKAERLWIAAGLGVLSSLALAVIGATPYNLASGPHYTALFVWIVTLLAAASLHALALLCSREGTGLFALPSVGLAMVLAYYLARGVECISVPGLERRPEALAAAIATQKYVVGAVLAWYAALSARMLIWPPDDGRQKPRKEKSAADNWPKRTGIPVRGSRLR